MISITKLMSLGPLHRARKAAQTLGHIEADYRLGSASAAAWVADLAFAFAHDSARSEALHNLAANIAKSYEQLEDPILGCRLVNQLARSLELEVGISPADWDFREPLGLSLCTSKRTIFSGVRAFLEDIRAPFNVGAIFRSADALGVSELLLSEFTASPEHPRASRSAMGACDIVPWRRENIANIKNSGNVFALELRGTNIDDFVFPEQGTVVLGSEELGVSPEAMALCSDVVSIPMLGAKGSLNVGVAFGIVMNAWRSSLMARGIYPQAE